MQNTSAERMALLTLGTLQWQGTLHVVLVFAFLVSIVAKARAGEWLTWGGDPQRTAWNRNETKLSKRNVANLQLKWKTQIDKEVPIEAQSGASALTAPLLMQDVKTAQGTKDLIFTLSPSNTVSALDTRTGSIVWQRTVDNTIPPARAATWTCTNTATATPVIDKATGTLYLVASDGRLHALSVSDGKEQAAPVDFVPAYSRNWSLNLVDGVIYTTVGRGCGNPPAQTTTSEQRSSAGHKPTIVPVAAQEGSTEAAPNAARPAQVASHMAAMDLNAPGHPVARFFTSPSRPSGAWTRAGMVWAQNSLLVETADGAWDPATGKWGQTLLRLRARNLELLDYFTPPNLQEINSKDLDYGSGGTLEFPFGERRLVFSSGKDGTLYLHDAASLGGADHRTPLFSVKAGNDALLYASNGVWGAPATALDSRRERWIYVPMWGPPSQNITFPQSHSEAPDGSIMAFKVISEDGKPILKPMWVSRNLSVPDPPVVANGLVFAISTGENTIQRHTDPRYQKLYQRPDGPPVPTTGTLTAQERLEQTGHAVLYAFDAQTGQELYSSKDLIDDWTHLSSVVVADGQVYVTTRKSVIYAFGLK